MESIMLTTTTTPALIRHRNITAPFHLRSSKLLGFPNPIIAPTSLVISERLVASRKSILLFPCCFESDDGSVENYPQPEDEPLFAPLLKRWDVPWKWHSILLTCLACVLCDFLGAYFISECVSGLDDIAMNILTDMIITCVATLSVIYTLYSSYPISDDLFCFDPFNRRKGWLLWAVLGLFGTVICVKSVEAILSTFGYLMRPNMNDAVVLNLPFIGFSKICTTCVLATSGVLVPILEEHLFRGFLMVVLTKWVPTPVAVVLSAAIFALAHLPCTALPQIFVSGIVIGCSYAQTRNLLTPITIHALYNSGIILILTFLKWRGYDLYDYLGVTF